MTEFHGSPEIETVEKKQEADDSTAELGTLALSMLQDTEQLSPVSYEELVKEKLDELIEKVDFPFNDETVLSSIYELAKQLNPKLEQYDLIIGDDTSGRLLALLYGKLVNYRRQELGMEPAEIRFMDGKYRGEVPSSAFPKETDKNARTLIATELVNEGKNISNIYRAATNSKALQYLENNFGISGLKRDRSRVDIAALNARFPTTPEGKHSYARLQDLNLYSVNSIYQPEFGEIEENFYGNKQLPPIKGVEKNSGNMYARRLPKERSDSQKLTRSRKDINLLADELYSLLPSPDKELPADEN